MGVPGSNPNWPKIQVLVDFTNPGSSSTNTWTDITAYCRRIGDGQMMQAERGRNYERAQTDAGTCVLLLDNSTGAFDPSNTASPFYPGVKPIRKVRVTATYTSPNPNVVPNGTFDSSLTGWIGSGWNGTNSFPTLSGAGLPLSTVSATTSLPTTSLPSPLGAGTIVTTTSGSNTQGWRVAAPGASAGATSIPVVSQVANFAYPSGSSVTWPVVTQQSSVVHDGAGAMQINYETRAISQTQLVSANTITGLPVGAVYTVSAWVQSPVGQSRVQLYVDDGAGGAPQTAVGAASGAWVQISTTYTITASGTMRIGFYNGDATTAGWVAYVDTVVATNNAAPAPTTYSLFAGLIEDWPRLWEKSGFWGEISATARGVFSSLSNVNLNALWLAASITDNAAAIYRMDDASGSIQASNSSSIQQLPLPVTAFAGAGTSQASKFGFGGTQGSAPNLGGDPSASLSLAPEPGGVLGQKGYYLYGQSSNLFLYTTAGWSWEGAINLGGTGTTSGSGGVVFCQSSGFNKAYQIVIGTQGGSGAASGHTVIAAGVSDATGTISVSSDMTAGAGGGDAGSASTVSTVDDGAWHHILVTMSAAGVINLYVDGNRYIRHGSITPTGWSVQPTEYYIGAVTGNGYGAPALIFTGNIKNAAWYPGIVLTPTQALNHYNSAAGYPGDDTGTRIARLLNGVPYTSYVLDTGNSLLGPADVDGKNLVQAIQDANDTEVGTLIERGDGQIVFKNRQSRGGTASLATFGESANPYEDGIQILQDPKEIYTSVKVSRNQGATVINTDTAAALDFFPRTLTINSLDNTDLQAIYLSEYQLARYKGPHDRIPNLTLKPSANPSLWPQALGREIGDRITVTRNNPGAPGITEDFYIDKITHQVGQPLEWKTIWMLSSASLYDAWILGSAQFGVLGSTTILGF